MRANPTARKRCVLVGVGGWGRAWVNRFLPASRDQIDVVALADIDREALTSAAARLGVASDRCYVDAEEALRKTDADFCVLCVQPHLREHFVELAVERGMHVLGEKPIAHSWDASVRIHHLVTSAGQKMATVQNYRFLPTFVLVRKLLDEGRVGALNYITCRFAMGFTPHNAGGAFRHQVPDAMLYEGAVHHLDQLRYLAGADGAWITGGTWKPAWSDFANPPCGLFLMEMANGVRCQYEINNVAFGEQSGWHQEQYRLECERGSIVVAGTTVQVHELQGDPRDGALRTETIHAERAPDAGHHQVLDDFLHWIDGGRAAPTSIDANLGTAALVFGAVEASRNGGVVDVSALAQSTGSPPVRTSP